MSSIANPVSCETRRPAALALSLAIATIVLAILLSPSAMAQQPYRSPEAAVTALVAAAKTDNQRAILAVLGRNAADIASSGDPVADLAMRQRFTAAYDAKHRLVREGDNKATLIIGAEEFPFPIPLVRKGRAWRFDSVAGRREILLRRIGRNELDAIQTCLAYVDAQNEYAEKARTAAGAGVYAQRIVSRPGTKDGLYWPAVDKVDVSPLGELFAQASAEGYQTGAQAPFHGYYFRILTQQGPSAPGGQLDYVVRGKMIGGFALVAYPAEYGNSGIMTFLVNHSGKVFQRDLGPQTARIVSRMTSYNPDRFWREAVTKAASR